MRSLILGFTFGALCLQNSAYLPNNLQMWCLGVGALLVCALIVLIKQKLPLQSRLREPTLILALNFAGIAIGYFWAAIFAHYRMDEQLPHAWQGHDITVVGTIANLPHQFEGGVRFLFSVEHAQDSAGHPIATNIVPKKIALSWYGRSHNANQQTTSKVDPGARWQFAVRLQRPHGNTNPHGFDYEAWLLGQGIRATGYVRGDSLQNNLIEPFVWSPLNWIERERSQLREKIRISLKDKPYSGVIIALVLGDQRAIEQSDWTIFNRTGIGHLVSISGLHITMIASLFGGGLLFLWKRSFFTRAQLPLLIPAQKIAGLGGFVAAFIYVMLAGCGIPALRTLYMIGVITLALWSGRIIHPSHVLCFALGVVILFDPWAVLWPGFWLSFGAVTVMTYGVQYALVERSKAYDESFRMRLLRPLKEAAYLQYLVTFGLVPLTLLLFGQISLVSPLANALAIPIVSFLVVPLAFLGSVLPTYFAQYVLIWAHELMQILAQFLTWLSQYPLVMWNTPIPALWQFFLALSGTIWLLNPRSSRWRFLGIITWLPLFLNSPTHPPYGQLRIVALDVGQGMAVLIETKNKRLLYDTGPFFSSESNGATRVILPYLRGRGITQLDILMVSHQDSDHSGGALDILKSVPVTLMMSSLSAHHEIVSTAAKHSPCAVGQNWEWDGVNFEVLHPILSNYESPNKKANALSCTLKITAGSHSILLPGDIEAPQERALLSRHPDKLKANVLLVPHHGSGTSSTVEFLRAVDPQLALFQIGHRNRYHHPKPEIYSRYQDMGIERMRTDESGAIILELGDNLIARGYRKYHARYWYEN